jgi:hypothetical protein
LLHALIGIGNALLQYIVDFGEKETHCLPRLEIKFSKDILKTEQTENKAAIDNNT